MMVEDVLVGQLHQVLSDPYTRRAVDHVAGGRPLQVVCLAWACRGLSAGPHPVAVQERADDHAGVRPLSSDNAVARQAG